MSGPIQIGNIPGVPGLTADVTGETGGIMFSFFNDSPDGTILVNFTVTGPNFPHNQAHTVFDYQIDYSDYPINTVSQLFFWPLPVGVYTASLGKVGLSTEWVGLEVSGSGTGFTIPTRPGHIRPVEPTSSGQRGSVVVFEE